MQNFRCAGVPQDTLLCRLALRPWPDEMQAGGHLRVLSHAEWHGYLLGGKCHCDPKLEWALSPIGSPVEVLLGSPEHHLCDTTYVNEAALVVARVEFVFEALFVAGEIPEFEAVLGREPTAMAHILALRPLKHSEVLERAQHLARVVAAHLAAKDALA